MDQDLILNKLKLLHTEECSEKPFMIKLLDSKMPDKFKLIGINKINQIKNMDKGESNKLVKWVESFLKLPFNNVKLLIFIYNVNFSRSLCTFLKFLTLSHFIGVWRG